MPLADAVTLVFYLCKNLNKALSWRLPGACLVRGGVVLARGAVSRAVVRGWGYTCGPMAVAQHSYAEQEWGNCEYVQCYVKAAAFQK